MTKVVSAKHKIDRRWGVNLWGRPKSPVNKRSYGPGQHGQKNKKLSGYGLQLSAKQKLKGYYGNIGERQFHRVYLEAMRLRGDTGEKLVELLERRLDAVVYRLKFAPTIFASRQFVSHGHVTVNGGRVRVPSYKVRDGDVIEVKQNSKNLLSILESVSLQERDVPDYIEADHKNMSGKFLRGPALSDIPYAAQMEPHLVVEFYSR